MHLRILQDKSTMSKEYSVKDRREGLVAAKRQKRQPNPSKWSSYLQMDADAMKRKYSELEVVARERFNGSSEKNISAARAQIAHAIDQLRDGVVWVTLSETLSQFIVEVLFKEIEVATTLRVSKSGTHTILLSLH